VTGSLRSANIPNRAAPRPVRDAASRSPTGPDPTPRASPAASCPSARGSRWPGPRVLPDLEGPRDRVTLPRPEGR